MTDGPPEHPEPWPLRMDRDCRTFGQFPQPGGWYNQSDFEMAAMRIARMAEIIYTKQTRGEKWTAADAEFIAWMESD